jgi:hypothetical protein
MILLLQEATTASAAQGAASTAGLGIGLSELLSGAVGALSIFLLGVVREMWRQRRERIALMTLVHLEVMHNKRILDRIQEGRRDYSKRNAQGKGLRQDAWEQNRARLTQLEGGRIVDYLATYYTVLSTFINLSSLVGNNKELSAETNEALEKLIKTLTPLATYVCARQTGYVRGWSHGMLVVGGKFKKDEYVEKNLRERGPPERERSKSYSDLEPPATPPARN